MVVFFIVVCRVGLGWFCLYRPFYPGSGRLFSPPRHVLLCHASAVAALLGFVQLTQVIFKVVYLFVLCVWLFFLYFGTLGGGPAWSLVTKWSLYSSCEPVCWAVSQLPSNLTVLCHRLSPHGSLCSTSLLCSCSLSLFLPQLCPALYCSNAMLLSSTKKLLA